MAAGSHRFCYSVQKQSHPSRTTSAPGNPFHLERAPDSPRLTWLQCHAAQLTSTALTVSRLASTSWQKVTGAAHMTLSVNTPAATASQSHVMSARSALVPLARSPPYMPA